MTIALGKAIVMALTLCAATAAAKGKVIIENKRAGKAISRVQPGLISMHEIAQLFINPLMGEV